MFKYKLCIRVYYNIVVTQSTSRNGNLESVKLVSDAITALLPTYIDVLVWTPRILTVVHKQKLRIRKIKYRGWQNWIQMETVAGVELLYCCSFVPKRTDQAYHNCLFLGDCHFYFRAAQTQVETVPWNKWQAVSLSSPHFGLCAFPPREPRCSSWHSCFVFWRFQFQISFQSTCYRG